MVASEKPRFAVCISLSTLMVATAAIGQEASEETTVLAPIIVTGERRARSLSDTFVGASILERGRVERDEQSQKTVNDVVTTTPNVFVEGKSELPSIRGVLGGGAGGLASAGLPGALPRSGSRLRRADRALRAQHPLMGRRLRATQSGAL